MSYTSTPTCAFVACTETTLPLPIRRIFYVTTKIWIASLTEFLCDSKELQECVYICTNEHQEVCQSSKKCEKMSVMLTDALTGNMTSN